MDIVGQLQWRYAVKKFDSERILSPDRIEMLKKAFNLTATSYGLQPIKMMVLHNKKIQQQLVPFSYSQEQVLQASHVLVLCIENHIDGDFISRYFEQVKRIRGTSEKILNPFKNALVDNFTNKEIAEVQTWATNQAYLAMGNLLTICALERIDSCPMEGFVPAAYDRILGLGEMGLTAVLVMPIGYRAADDMTSGFKKVRKNLDDSVIDVF